MFGPEHEKLDSFVSELCFNKDNGTSLKSVARRHYRRKVIPKYFLKLRGKHLSWSFFF